MKRRVLSLITALALCLSLCPVRVLAADEGADDGLCPHHPAHTDVCGYASPTPERECTHRHDDDCYTIETGCTHQHTADCYSNPDYVPEVDEPDLCAHICREDSGCLTRTLACPHEHDDVCGYAAQDPGEPCGYACKICPVESLIGELPHSVSASNIEQVGAQLSEIYDLYDELTAEEQKQVDLSPCLALQDQMDGIGAEALAGGVHDASAVDEASVMGADGKYTKPYQVSKAVSIDTNGFTMLGTKSSVIQVTGTGELYLMGTVTSQKGAGVEVLAGGFLRVMAPGTATVITGTTYGLDVASGAEVQLAAGTYTGNTGAIRAEDGNYAALLAPGCAYFDVAGNVILPENAAAAKTLVVGQCTSHAGKTYAYAGTRHTWTCPACRTTESEKCTFTFDSNGAGTCVCGNSLTITVDESKLGDLIYDGADKTANVTLTVVSKDGGTLVKDTDYTVDCSTRADVGEVTVTVTGIEFNGTFTKTYQVTQDQPGIKWDSPTAELEYDGRRATIENELPHITITLQPGNNEDLQKNLQYSYRNVRDTEFTDGLPLNAGEYEVKAYIPESHNYKEAVTDPLLKLTIKKINPVATAPVAVEPPYNRGSQALVTPGAVDPRAVGAVILFATSENGDYSTEIPTGIDARDYRVWYKVEGTDNYNAVDPTEILGVEILRKVITPIVTLSEYTYLYDGGYKRPGVTVKDEDDVTVLLDTEYQVSYVNNRNVSTPGNPAQVVVSDQNGGNYEIRQVTVDFEITSRAQEALSITGKPDTIVYGDKFTLSTSGGSGSGDVTWEITSGTDVAKVDQKSGQVTITGHGSATVKATKSAEDPETGEINYEDATASWTFTAEKKPVVATVTAEDRDYNGRKDAVVHAVVEQGVLPGDVITIGDLPGEFIDENAGVDKTVTVDISDPTFGGDYEHYVISFPSATVKATIHKAVVKITAPPVSADPIYDGTAQALIGTGAVVDTAEVDVEYALSEDGPYSKAFPEGTNAGTYTVWYRVEETGNYAGLPAVSMNARIQKRPVTMPSITLSGDGLQTDNAATPPYSYVYDGNVKEPDVALKDDSGVLIPADEYTVAYSGNTNVGSASVTVTAKADGNYSFAPVTERFAIVQKKAQVITAPDAAGDPLFYNTRAQRLVTAGTGSGGTMVYSTDNVSFTAQIPTKTTAGDYIVYYKVEGDSNHSDSNVGQVTVTIAPKTVNNPTVELRHDDGSPFVSCTYDGTAKEPKVVVKDGSTVIGGNEYNVVYSDNVDAGRAAVNITAKPSGNYTVTGSASFVIQKAEIKFDRDPAPAAIMYDGRSHELLVEGTTDGGEVLYALNSKTGTYTAAIPTATEAGDYFVWYKVIGDKNHNDFAAKSQPVTIARKKLTAITIELTPGSFEYDGTVKLPQITVKDGRTVLPEEEYTWECTLNGTAADEPKDEGTYTITITDAAGGNYDLTKVGANTATFEIGKTAQDELVIRGQPAAPAYGDTFQLSTSGGVATGTVSWAVMNGPATIDPSGNVEITGVGEVTITATKSVGQNYKPVSAQWTFTAAPKPVTASVVVQDRDYDGTTAATVTSATILPTDLVSGSDTVTIDPASISAAFDTPAAGTNKTVTLDTSKVQVSGGDVAKYAISYPDTVTANITQAAAKITTAPKEVDSLEYSGEPQALVTPGRTNVGFIVYSLDGTNFSPEIPTGTDAKIYTVYYRIDETDDYTGVPVNVSPLSVTIAPKNITPRIELSESSYPYDGSRKEPKITVKDGTTVIDQTQYTVTWAGDKNQSSDEILKAVGTYTATIANVTTGNNYTFSETVTVEVVAAAQSALSITGKPAHVYYGDTVTTLGTTGGSGQGKVTWRITTTGAKSSIDGDSGELCVKDTGSITVEAERTVDNYGTVTAVWTFTVEPKPVTAQVKIKPKTYDGNTTIADSDITAAVNSSDLVDPADSFVIEGLKGAYTDANAGTGKAVRLNKTGMTTTADPAKYAVSCPDTAAADITPRRVDVTVKLSDHDLQTDSDGSYFYVFDNTEKTPAVTVTADDDSAKLAAGDYAVTYSNNKNAGHASVTVKSAAGGNYTFDDQTVPFEIKKAGAQLTSSPQAKELTYTGKMQELVTVGTAEGGHVEYALNGGAYSADIPKADKAGTYVVTYKAVGDGSYEESTTVGSVTVTIKPKEVVSPTITVTGSYTYDGSPKTPSGAAVEVKDGEMTIPDTEYTLAYSDNINAGTATVRVINANGGNYIVNGTAAFEITQGTASVVTPPESIRNLPYNGAAQALVKAGKADNGAMVYALDEKGPYSPVIPTALKVGNYPIWYKAQGDSNYKDSEPKQVAEDASIVVNQVTAPTILVTPESATYNGNRQEPVVTVKDDEGLLIDSSEYTVAYAMSDGNGNLTDAGEYIVSVKNRSNSNYIIDSTAKFEILPAGQEPLTITNTREHVYYGDEIQLGVSGGNGTVSWSVGGSSIASISAGGLLQITGVGPVTVTATSTVDNYAQQTATWPIHVEKKPVTAVVKADAKTYDGKTPATTTVTATLQKGDLVGTDQVQIQLTGTFEDANAGTDKKVNIDASNPTFTGSTGNYGYYNISYPATATASILKADIDPAKVTPPTAAVGLVYTGSAQYLVGAPGSSADGALEYSKDGGVTYSAGIPTGVDAGNYEVWYRVKGDGNHNDLAGKKLATVTIDPQDVTSPIIEFTPSGASYDGAVHKPSVTVKDNNGRVIPVEEYTVTYGSTDWKTAGGHQVTVTDKTGGNYNVTTKTETFTIDQMGQNPLSIVNQPGKVYYGDTFTLSATGGSGTGKVTWKSSSETVATIDQNGLVTVHGSGGPVTITATKEADDNYSAASVTWTFHAEKKPVTPIVAAMDKKYNGDNIAKLDITWKPGDLLDGDTINLDGILAGRFDDANVGSGKRVTITVADGSTLPDGGGKYDVKLPAPTTASITPAAATVTKGPEGAQKLTYTGQPQPLLADLGSAKGGNLAYSLDGVNYSFNSPMGTEAKTYTVWYKVAAGENYKDSTPEKMDVQIAVNKVNDPKVSCTPGTFQYDGTEKTPAVVVRDDAGRVIPESEYTVLFDTPRIAVGPYNVTVTDNPGGNYQFDSQVTGTFEIAASSQNPLSIITDKSPGVCYGDTFRLSAMGGSGGGAIRWSSSDNAVAAVDSDGRVTVKGTGAFTVTAYREADGSYSKSNEAAVSFYADPKPITPVVTAEDKPYDGKRAATLHAAWKSGDLVDGDQITLTVGSGEFATADVGTNKQVAIHPGTFSGDTGNYRITWPDSTTASINKVDAKLSAAPAKKSSLTYNGAAQDLVTAGSTIGSIGTIEYSLSEKGEYSPAIPRGTKAGPYTVWYKVADSVNYTGIAPVLIEVEIGKATPTIVTVPQTSEVASGRPLSDSKLTGGSANGVSGSITGTFAWTDSSVMVEAGKTEYEVTFTPDDGDNYNTKTFNIKVAVTAAAGGGDGTGGAEGGSGTGTDSGSGTGTGDAGGSGTGTNNAPAASGPSAPSSESTSSGAGAQSTAGAPLKATVQNGTASTVVSAADGSKLVKEAVESQSDNIVIKPEITGDVTKAEVSIPASTVSRIKSETDAALTVSAPIADVTISREALDTLSRAGDTVSVATEQVDQSVVMTLTADGKAVESVPGGVTLTVPVEDAAPGTVAVLVHEDGTRETIRKSVVEDGKLSIPLDGSATVEIVDNSKEFADVSPASWEADAVAFASAHELFNGTSETTFSPDEAMSRGMLATVLYNLEGQPDQDQACTFGDISSDAWYADGVSWAAANGIANGYSDGQFGPDDSITREQFAVMLWRYAGSPETSGGDLNFTDAGQASEYTLEALRWATANGIMNGYGNGQLDPGGTATRAQAAQMLKNFMENT